MYVFPITLRKLNSTLRIQVPHEFKRRFGLNEGDEVVWEEEANGDVRLKFKRRAEKVGRPVAREAA
jgi:bifunctional DNA-binding transcriptional regulator/antitoxin component of YhaV-PrlF toxin-antitoxin module